MSWPGRDFLARAQYGHAALTRALIAEVRVRTPHATIPEALATMDAITFTRSRVGPMVQGLFPADEQATVLDLLGRSVIFLTPATIRSYNSFMPVHRTSPYFSKI